MKTHLHVSNSNERYTPWVGHGVADTSPSCLLREGQAKAGGAKPSLHDWTQHRISPTLLPCSSDSPAAPALIPAVCCLHVQLMDRKKWGFTKKGEVKLRDWDLQKSCSVPGGWKHSFVSQFLPFCIFKSKFPEAVWLVSVIVLTISGEGIKSMMAVLHKQLNDITFRHPESITFSTSLQCFLNNQGTVKFF